MIDDRGPGEHVDKLLPMLRVCSVCTPTEHRFCAHFASPHFLYRVLISCRSLVGWGVEHGDVELCRFPLEARCALAALPH
eukprot:SAG11_NODE_22890_length_398_cov_1.240803_1_plen_79_part_01